MSQKNTPFSSRFVIDGIQQELSPEQILNSVCEASAMHESSSPSGTIIDERLDRTPYSYDFDSEKVDSYLSLCTAAVRKTPVDCASSYARECIACALISALCHKGSFRLGNLSLEAAWNWNGKQIGNMSAFFDSVEAVGDYLDSLGLKLHSYAYEEAPECRMSFEAAILSEKENDPFVNAAGSGSVQLLRDLAVSPSFSVDPESWIIYVPFESCDFRLGGSLLEQRLGVCGENAPNIGDADYFMDCFEVVRELVEDGILLSAAPVGDGGMITTIRKMAGPDSGADIDISDIVKSYDEKNIVRILFSETPGMVIQIRDSDFDYIDAEMLLQDVAYFPLGHPLGNCRDIRVKASGKTGIQKILESLINERSAEGED